MPFSFPKCSCGREIIPPRGRHQQSYVKCAWCVSPAKSKAYKEWRLDEARAALERMGITT